MVFSLSSEVIGLKFDTETTQERHLILRSFFPTIRMTMSIPVIHTLIQCLDGQVTLDDQPTLRRECHHDLFQQLHMAGAVAPWAGQDQSLPSCRFKSTMHPQFATSPIIWFKGHPVRSRFPFFSGVGFHRNRPHFIYTDPPSARWGSNIDRYDAPLFFHELRIMFPGFVEPTLLAFPVGCCQVFACSVVFCRWNHATGWNTR